MGLERAQTVAHAHWHPFGFDGPNGLFVHVASLNTRSATGWCGRCHRAGFPVADICAGNRLGEDRLAVAVLAGRVIASNFIIRVKSIGRYI